tara:strand:- start:1752 stop:1889 length:138 start_codon:yes stop_codon:yes gene_type:complete
MTNKEALRIVLEASDKILGWGCKNQDELHEAMQQMEDYYNDVMED